MSSRPLVVFDLDGTLATTNDVDGDCFVEAMQAEFGFVPGSDWSAYEHCTDEGIAVEALTGHLGRPPDALQLKRLKHRFVDLLASAAAAKPHLFAPVAGAPELLRHLVDSGWLLCIATGAWRALAEVKLKAAGLPESIPLFCSDGIPRREAILVPRWLMAGRSPAFHSAASSRSATLCGMWWRRRASLCPSSVLARVLVQRGFARRVRSRWFQIFSTCRKRSVTSSSCCPRVQPPEQ